jgi:hypothetical protein
LLTYIIELLDQYGINYDVKHHRVRCQGHILNLAAQAFLKCTNDDQIEGDHLTLNDLAKWRKYGAIGKLHTFTVRRQRSPQQYQKFLQMSKDKHLHRDNKTRWNSYAIAIQTALLPQVRQAINRWFIEYSAEQEE